MMTKFQYVIVYSKKDTEVIIEPIEYPYEKNVSKKIRKIMEEQGISLAKCKNCIKILRTYGKNPIKDVKFSVSKEEIINVNMEE